MRILCNISRLELGISKARSTDLDAARMSAHEAFDAKLGNFVKHDLLEKWSYPLSTPVPDRAQRPGLGAPLHPAASQPNGSTSAHRRQEAALDEIAA